MKEILLFLILLASINLKGQSNDTAPNFKETLEWIDAKISKYNQCGDNLFHKEDFYLRRIFFKNDSLIYEMKTIYYEASTGQVLREYSKVTFSPNDVNYKNILINYNYGCAWVVLKCINDRWKFRYEYLGNDGNIISTKAEVLNLSFNERALKDDPELPERIKKAWTNLIIQSGGKGEVF